MDRAMKENDDKTLVTTGYQCFHCGTYGVYWEADFDYEDYGLEGEGIVQNCHCANCGADIMYFVPLDRGEEES